jgi:hypothetical protein
MSPLSACFGPQPHDPLDCRAQLLTTVRMFGAQQASLDQALAQRQLGDLDRETDQSVADPFTVPADAEGGRAHFTARDGSRSACRTAATFAKASSSGGRRLWRRGLGPRSWPTSGADVNEDPADGRKHFNEAVEVGTEIENS